MARLVRTSVSGSSLLSVVQNVNRTVYIEE